MDSLLVTAILQHLKIKKAAPTLPYLKQLIIAYCTNIPWESASRIVRKSSCDKVSKCLRLENEFWNSAMHFGTGGTCYESNWAFFCLLQSLEYKGYLTINTIEDRDSAHSAIILFINEQKYIVDIGYPLYAPILIPQKEIAITSSPFSSYHVKALKENKYVVENHPHLKPYLFHLADAPVTRKDYVKIATDDYDDQGLFLDRIILRKLVNNKPTRFDDQDLPLNIHILEKGERKRTLIDVSNLISALNSHFHISEVILKQAFTILKK